MNDTDEDADTTEPDASTESTAARWWGTNDILAGFLVVALVGLTTWFTYDVGSVPLWLASVFALSALTAVVWAFGKGAFSAAADALSNE